MVGCVICRHVSRDRLRPHIPNVRSERELQASRGLIWPSYGVSLIEWHSTTNMSSRHPESKTVQTERQHRDTTVRDAGLIHIASQIWKVSMSAAEPEFLAIASDQCRWLRRPITGIGNLGRTAPDLPHRRQGSENRPRDSPKLGWACPIALSAAPVRHYGVSALRWAAAGVTSA